MRIDIAASTTSRPRRRALAAALPVVVALGLLTRFGLSGGLADGAGGVFYTVLVYVLIAFAWPFLRPVHVGLAAFGCSALVEFFQLTSVPADLGEAFPPAKLVLGSSFVATDLLAYAAGALLAVGVDTALRRRRHRLAG